MNIVSTGTALPRHYYPQDVLIDAFRQHWGNKLERFAVLEHLHTATRVDGRYLVLPIEAYPGLKRWGDAKNVWLDAAQELGQEAICKALDRGGIDRQRPEQLE